jgi:hypothetical protein
MGLIKFLVWTGCAVGLGVFLASAEIQGRTPLQHVQQTWRRHVPPSQLERVKVGLQDSWEETRESVSRKTREQTAPRERITAEDRAALERILARQK